MSHKRWSSWIVLSIFILTWVLWIQVPAKAEEGVPYSITGYTSNITLYADGSVYFDESITYQLLQESVEIIKPIPMAYSSKVEDMEILNQIPTTSENSEDAPEYEPLKSSDVPAAGNADVYHYALADVDGDIYHITIPVQGSKRDEVTFVYRYKMMDTVFLYKDTAAFFWQFIQPGQGIEAKNVIIEVSLPDVVSMEEWNGYARGAAYTEKELLEDGKFRIVAERIRDDEFLESVLLVPNLLFPEGRKVIDNYVEDEILSDMSIWEDQATRTRREEELQFYGGWGIAFLTILLCMGTGLLLYLKTRKKKVKESDVTDNSKEGIPDPLLSPAEAGILLSRGKLGSKELFATVLTLIQSRFLELQHNQGLLVLLEDVNHNRLKAHEEYVLNWLMKDLGDGKTVSLTVLENLLVQYNRNHRHKISTWESLINQKSSKRDPRENISKMKIWAMGAVIISLVAAVLAGLVLKNQVAGLLAGVFALALAAYVIPLKKINDSIRLKQAQWDKYREELKTQHFYENDKLPLTKWEERFVYAVSMGNAEEVLERLLQSYKNNEFEDGNLTILYRSNHPWLTDILRKL